MVATVAKFSASGYRDFTPVFTTTAGGEGYDGMYQLVIRASRGPHTSMLESEYNLPPAEDFKVQRLEGSADGLTFMWTRKIAANSPSITIEQPTTPTNARGSKMLELIFNPHQQVDQYWNSETGGTLELAYAPPYTTILNIRTAYATASYRGINNLSGMTVIDAVRTGQYNLGMLHNVSMQSVGAQEAGFYISGRSSDSKVSVFADVTLFLSEMKGLDFQIMHNGQLIPATPNLWSGGQLTRVGLNLPE